MKSSFFLATMLLVGMMATKRGGSNEEEAMERYGKRLSVHWKTLMLSIAVTAALAFNASGMEPEQSTNQTSGTEQSTNQASDTELKQLLKLLEDQTKMLMTADAQRGFQERFKTSFNPEKTRLLLGYELKRWVQAHRPKVPLPEPMKTAISANLGIGLLIEQGLPGNNGGQQNVVYMRASSFGGRPGLFLNEDPDPCGDGNPAMCEFCSGGCGSGCFCTMGCGACQVCPRC